MPPTCRASPELGTPEPRLLAFPGLLMCSPRAPLHSRYPKARGSTAPLPGLLPGKLSAARPLDVSPPMSHGHVHPPCLICTPHPHSRLLSLSGVPFMVTGSGTRHQGYPGRPPGRVPAALCSHPADNLPMTLLFHVSFLRAPLPFSSQLFCAGVPRQKKPQALQGDLRGLAAFPVSGHSRHLRPRPSATLNCWRFGPWFTGPPLFCRCTLPPLASSPRDSSPSANPASSPAWLPPSHSSGVQGVAFSPLSGSFLGPLI